MYRTRILMIGLLALLFALPFGSLTYSQSQNEQAKTAIDQKLGDQADDVAAAMSIVDKNIQTLKQSVLKDGNYQTQDYVCSHPNGCEKRCTTGACICYGVGTSGCYCSSC